MNALLILGMHRSGTSALAGQCARGGIWFGDGLLPPRADNPKGYYENTEIMLSNDQLVTLLFGAWDSPISWTAAASSFPLDHPRIIEIQERLKGILGTLNSTGRLWAVKDPRLSRLLPIWWPMLSAMDIEVGLVMSIRRPAEVVASLEKRDCLGPTTSRLLWMRHVADPLAYALDQGLRIVIVPYDELLAEPDRLSDRLQVIGIHLEQHAADAAFADKALRHHAHEAELPDDVLSLSCETLYQAALSIPVFDPATVTDEIVGAIRTAQDIRLDPYLDSLYAEALGVSSPAQRLFHEQKQSKARAEARALRQRLRNSEQKLRRCQADLERRTDSTSGAA